MYAMASSAPLGRLTIFSPVLMTTLLLRVSGVTLLEKGLKDSKPGYREYIVRTPAFVPWRPGRNGKGTRAPADNRR
jgi:steroid 5-alpha reductase family enzyme